MSPTPRSPPAARPRRPLAGPDLGRLAARVPRADDGNFPNLFRIGGAGTATGHISHILQIESGVRYAVEALRAMDAHGLSSVEVTEAAERAYAPGRRRARPGPVFVTGGCTSWYLDSLARPRPPGHAQPAATAG